MSKPQSPPPRIQLIPPDTVFYQHSPSPPAVMWLPAQLQLQLLASALLLPTAFARPGPEADRVHHDQLLKRDPFLALEKAYESAAILAALPRSPSPAIVARAAAEDCSATTPTQASTTSTPTSTRSSTPSDSNPTSTRSSTSSASTPTSTGGSSGCTVAMWGQCGGKSYGGCTTCASGSTCKYFNDYYSQCL